METTNEHRVFKFRGNKKGAISVPHNKWRVITMIYWIRYISKACGEIPKMHAGFTVTGWELSSEGGIFKAGKVHLEECTMSLRLHPVAPLVGTMRACQFVMSGQVDAYMTVYILPSTHSYS